MVSTTDLQENLIRCFHLPEIITMEQNSDFVLEQKRVFETVFHNNTQKSSNKHLRVLIFYFWFGKVF